MILRVGTSGYAYPAWKGSFYPEDLPTQKMLPYYAEHFSTVEINNTFYKMPTEKVLSTWSNEVAPGFSFVLKAPALIMERLRLNQAAADPLDRFIVTARALGPRLGPLYFRLPPASQKDLPRLEAFLSLVPLDVQAAFEFRHESWFEDDVLDLLRRTQTALCIADTDEGTNPIEATAKWGYLRLRRTHYSADDLRAWVKTIRAQNWTHAYLFFKHEDAGTGPKFATDIGRIWANTF